MENNLEIRRLIRESIMEEISQEKRYVATMEFYVYANDDQEAVNKAKSLANNMDMNLDNQASITDLVKQEHGTIGNTPVDFNEGVMKMLKRKFSRVSDEQADYNKKHGLPDDWNGSKEGFYEKHGEGNSSAYGSNE